MADNFSPTSVPTVPGKLLWITIILSGVLLASILAGIAGGSTLIQPGDVLKVLWGHADLHPTVSTIIWKIRLPRVLLAAGVGATLALGGMVFQALLRNALAEPYILGISGGSAVGAITGILLGFSFFPGITFTAFAGSMLCLGAILTLASGRSPANNDSLLLGGVMMNAFCGAIIMFLISISQSSQVQHILIWLMGDLSMGTIDQLPILLACLPCFAVIFLFAKPLNIYLTGKESAMALGVNVTLVALTLLITTSLMVSLVVSQSGLIGFVGLVIPHIFRILVGPDHRLLVPCCLLGGSSYLVLCDLIARTLPSEGEMPVGIITALIGAPVFILLLWREKREG